MWQRFLNWLYYKEEQDLSEALNFDEYSVWAQYAEYSQGIDTCPHCGGCMATEATFPCSEGF